MGTQVPARGLASLMGGRAGALGLMVVLALPAALSSARADAPERVTSIVVYGDDPCPQAKGDEIVVCAREPDSERYRIPKKLRETKKQSGGSLSWAARVRGLEDASRPQMPNSCSPVGSGGQTGCTTAMLRQWFLERQAAAAATSNIP